MVGQEYIRQNTAGEQEYYYQSDISYLVSNGTYTRPKSMEIYKPIHIKWNNGYMDVCPPALFDDGKVIAKFRKIVRLSILSDIAFKTTTIRDWKHYFIEEEKYLFRLYSEIEDMFNSLEIETLEKEFKTVAAKQKALKRVSLSHSNTLKRLNTRKAKVNKCRSIFEETIAKLQK